MLALLRFAPMSAHEQREFNVGEILRSRLELMIYGHEHDASYFQPVVLSNGHSHEPTKEPSGQQPRTESLEKSTGPQAHHQSYKNPSGSQPATPTKKRRASQTLAQPEEAPKRSRGSDTAVPATQRADTPTTASIARILTTKNPRFQRTVQPRDSARPQPDTSIAPESSPVPPAGRSPAEMAEADRPFLQQYHTEQVLALGNAMFLQGSDDWIILRTLIELHPTAQHTIAEWESRSGAIDVTMLDGADELCRPTTAIGLQPMISIALPRFLSNGSRTLSYPPYRYVAVFSLPLDELWKAVLKDDNGILLFHASARCNEYTGIDHCTTKSHLVIETRKVNQSVRKEHHKGKAGCWCALRCWGENVVYRDMTVYELQAQMQRLRED